MLEFRNVTVESRRRKILNKVSLKLEDGTILGLVGMDERARTMMLRVSSGGIHTFGGEIFLDGESFSSFQKEPIPISYMPLSYGFNMLLTVEESYDFILSLHKMNGRFRERRIDEVLEMMQLAEYKSAFIAELPTEVYPFLYLGQIILANPKWLMLDDPFQHLSTDMRNQMANILMMLHEMGVSMIINTPVAPDMRMLFTDVAIVENGKLVMSGPIEDVIEKATQESTIRMHVLDGLDEALEILKQNDLVERVIVDRDYVAFRFFGKEEDEARLLTALIHSGALLQNYTRDPIDLEWYFRR